MKMFAYFFNTKPKIGSGALSFRGRRIWGNRRGIALLLVLTMLLLLSLLVVGLLTTARQEVTTAKSYSDSNDVRSLADMTANFVISQLEQATNQLPNNPNNNDWAWISQPGLLRTFSPQGQQQVFKLYSSDKMVLDSGTTPSGLTYDPAAATTSEVPTNWYSLPNEFVDLNQPVTLGATGNLIYPIVDPTAAAAGNTSPPYPSGFAGIEGFSYGDGTAGSPAVPVAPATATSSAQNPLPMPVRWIYVTADGQFIASNDPNYKKATARIAFWADDETSKVNINTACGGVFYDMPALNTRDDHMLARTMPVAQEYNRFPGHPATTSLAPLFPQLRDPIIVDPRIRSRAAGAIAPRIAPATVNPTSTPATGATLGSDGGSLLAWMYFNGYNFGSGVGDYVALDNDRLFASVDEINYDSAFTGTNRTLSTILSTVFPPPPGLTVQKQVQQLPFFATVVSKAPELNLFNRPRITIWPFNFSMVNSIATNSSGATDTAGALTYGSAHLQLTPEDQLIKFASELGGYNPAQPGNYAAGYLSGARKRFYFQRESPWDPLTDWDGSLAGANDLNQDIPENRALFGYLEAMTAKAIPASINGSSARGGSDFQTKYTAAGRDQILTEVWDFIRSNVNLQNQAYLPVVNPNTGSHYATYSFPQDLQLYSGPNSPVGTARTGEGDIAPLQVKIGTDVYQGLGRYPVPVEYIVQFYHAGEVPDPSDPPGTPTHKIRRVRMVFLIHFMAPVSSLSAAGNGARFQIQVSGNTSFTLGLKNPGTGPTQIIGMRPMMNGTSSNAAGAWISGPFPLYFPTNTPPYSQIDLVAPSGGIFSSFLPNGTAGGSVGLDYPFSTLGSPLETQWNGNPTQLKILSNRIDAADVVACGAAYPNGSPPTSNAFERDYYSGGTAISECSARFGVAPSAISLTNRPDVIYPFASDVMEFRLPRTGGGPPTNPTQNAEYNADATFFKDVQFTGGDIEIKIFPGLKDKTNNGNFGTMAAWQDNSAAANYVYHTKFHVDDAVIPLPRNAPYQAVNYSTDRLHAINSEDVWWPNGLWDPAQVHLGGGDVFLSYVLDGDPTNNSDGPRGDIRLLSLVRDVPGSWYVKHSKYTTDNLFFRSYYHPNWNGGSTGVASPKPALFTEAGGELPHVFYDGQGQNRGYSVQAAKSFLGTLVNNQQWYQPTILSAPAQSLIAADRACSPTTQYAARAGSGTQAGDFTWGSPLSQMGALVQAPDMGSYCPLISAGAAGTTSYAPSDPAGPDPYYTTGANALNNSAYSGSKQSGITNTSAGSSTGTVNNAGILFSPFRQMPSPVMFGTLPSRALDLVSRSWETLLFCPNPSGGNTTHRGWSAPRDHYWLDLFYMPVAEPYAITEDFATAGKINLNYQIAPFTYIQRKTGMYALMDEMTKRWAPGHRPSYPAETIDNGSAIVAFPKTDLTTSKGLRLEYAQNATSTADSTHQYRYFVDINETLKQFDNRFATNDPFVSPSEICEEFLVPQGTTYSSDAAMSSWWNTNGDVTGDDKREMPYNHLYPRVTTRSNTFKVHFWVQTLNPASIQNAPGSPKPVVTGEYRGSMVVERYLDPNIPAYGNAIPASGTNTSVASNVDNYYPFMNTMYKYRRVDLRQFSP